MFLMLLSFSRATAADMFSLPSYYQELKKYHLQHHFKDYQKGFGVTSKFWDKVFGTELIYGPGSAKGVKEQ
jgi:sterol desaturase/sphingolipid hydroxylase (fatty acid hydroxylase superfamily)